MPKSLTSSPALTQRLRRLWAQFEGILQTAAASGDLAQAIEGALYVDRSSAAVQDYLSLLTSGGFKALPSTPTLRLNDGTAMAGAAGAFVGDLNRILINSDWLASASDEEVLRVLAEEYGHSLDARFNTQDTAGDEGERFAALLLGYTPSAATATKNDSIQVTWNRQTYLAEAAQLLGTSASDPFTAAGDLDYFTTNNTTTINANRDTVFGQNSGTVFITNRNSGTVIYTDQSLGNKTVDITVESVYVSSRTGAQLSQTFSALSVTDRYALTIRNLDSTNSPSALNGSRPLITTTNGTIIPGPVTLYGAKLNSTLTGGLGADFLYLQNNGTANGGDGADYIQIDKGGSAFGGSGNDTIYVNNSDATTWSVDVGPTGENNTVVLSNTSSGVATFAALSSTTSTTTSTTTNNNTKLGTLTVRSAGDVVFLPNTFGGAYFNTYSNPNSSLKDILANLIIPPNVNYVILSQYDRKGTLLATAANRDTTGALITKDICLVVTTDSAAGGKSLFQSQFSTSDETYEDTNYYISINDALAAFGSAGGIDLTNARLVPNPATIAGFGRVDPVEGGNYYVFTPESNKFTAPGSSVAVTFDVQVPDTVVPGNFTTVGKYTIKLEIFPLADPAQTFSLSTTKDTVSTLQDVVNVTGTYGPNKVTLTVASLDGSKLANANAGPNGTVQIGIGDTQIDSNESFVVKSPNALDSITLTFKELLQGESATVTAYLIDENGLSYSRPFTINRDPQNKYKLDTNGSVTIGLADMNPSPGTLGIQAFTMKAENNTSFKLSFSVTGLQDLILGTPTFSTIPSPPPTGNDTLTGNTLSDQIWGFSGDDSITGGTENDLIMPGKGANIIDGGAGVDVIRYYKGEGGGASPSIVADDGTPDTIIGSPTGDSIYIYDAVSVKSDPYVRTKTIGTDTTVISNWRLTATYSSGEKEAFDFLLPGASTLQRVSSLPPYAAQII